MVFFFFYISVSVHTMYDNCLCFCANGEKISKAFLALVMYN